MGIALAQLAKQPDLRKPPIAQDRLGRDVQSGSRFRDIKTAKETKFHDTTLPGVEGCKSLESAVQGKDVDWWLWARDRVLVHRHVHRVPSPLRRLTRTSHID